MPLFFAFVCFLGIFMTKLGKARGRIRRMSDPAQPHDPYRALRYSEFRWYQVASITLTVATLIQSVVMGWQIYEITHSALSLGLVELAEAVPCLGLMLVGGYAADRMDRRRLSMLASLLMLSGALILLFLNRHGHTPHTVWPYYGIQFMAGVARAFARPANQAMRTELVPRDALANAATWNSSMFNTALVLGPAIGGLLYGFGGCHVAYATQTGLMLISISALLLGVKPKPRATELRTGMWRSLKEGIAFVSKNQVILGAMSLDLFAVLFGGAPALLPIFASDILKVGPQGLGILRAAPAVGSILTALVLTHLPMRRAGETLLWAVGVFGLCWIVFAFSHSLVLSLLLLAISGAADSVSVVVRQTLVQLRTPPELMGRVSAVSQIFITSSNEVGAFESGLAARVLGLVPSVVFGGLMTLGVVGVTSWKAPELRRLKRL